MMRLTIEPTEHFIEVEGAICRVWTGTTPGGALVVVAVAGVAVPEGEDASEVIRAGMIDRGVLEQSADGVYRARNPGAA